MRCRRPAYSCQNSSYSHFICRTRGFAPAASSQPSKTGTKSRVTRTRPARPLPNAMKRADPELTGGTLKASRHANGGSNSGFLSWGHNGTWTWRTARDSPWGLAWLLKLHYGQWCEPIGILDRGLAKSNRVILHLNAVEPGAGYLVVSIETNRASTYLFCRRMLRHIDGARPRA